MRYLYTVPVTRWQGTTTGTCSDSFGQTHQQDAIWQYNSNRAHDGQPPIARMPKGTKYERRCRIIA